MELNFEGLSAELLPRLPELLPSWLPGGRLIGKEFTVGSLQGEPGQSLRVNVVTGKWADFSTGEKGGDPISLFAAIRGVNNGEAYKALATDHGYGNGNGTKKPKHTPREAVPVLGPPPPQAEDPLQIHEPNAKWWCYRDGAGEPLFYIIRRDPPNERKQFLPLSWSLTAECWVTKAYPAPRPLYGLDLLADRPEAPVMVVEGEKAAEAARKLAGKTYVVVTWAGGSQAVHKTDWSPLEGRRILLWPDADDPGKKAMQDVAAILAPICPEVKILDVTGQPDGWDAADCTLTWGQFVQWAKPRARIYQAATKLNPPAEITGTDQQLLSENDNSEPDSALPVPATNSEFHVEQPPEPVVYVSVADLPAPSTSQYALWESLGLQLTRAGNPVCNVDNVKRVLESLPCMKGLVWFDSFHDRFRTGRRNWTSDDDVDLCAYLQRHVGMSSLAKADVKDAVRSHARQILRNEPREWIESIKWDSVERINTSFHRLLGARESLYVNQAAHNFWISMVARIFEPGCKVDNMVILEGGQGVHKSKIAEAIGGEWYGLAQESISKKDFYLGLRGKMLIEIAELSNFKAELNILKRALSTRIDELRPVYGDERKEFRRTSIFLGTTNDEDYLKDATGNRRFWPILCGRINLPLLEEERPQLFAEALHRFKAGETWWEMPEVEVREEQEKRYQGDPWEEHIAAWLVGQRKIYGAGGQRFYAVSRQIATDALTVQTDRVDQKIQNRIARCMKRLGWERDSIRVGDEVRRVFWSPKETKTN